MATVFYTSQIIETLSLSFGFLIGLLALITFFSLKSPWFDRGPWDLAVIRVCSWVSIVLVLVATVTGMFYSSFSLLILSLVGLVAAFPAGTALFILRRRSKLENEPPSVD